MFKVLSEDSMYLEINDFTSLFRILQSEKSRYSPFSANRKCWKCQPNGVAAQVDRRFISSYHFQTFFSFFCCDGVHFPADEVNITPTASLENRSLADGKCAISFVSDTIVLQLTLASEADFKCESDSDCSDVDSIDYDSEQLVNGQNL